MLVAIGIGLSIFGLQQSVLWGWGNGGTWACIIGGLLVIVVFVMVEMRTASPLMDVTIFRIRAFFVENLVLFIAMAAFIPVFFFASEYAQISLRKTASESGLFLLYFFIGFAVAAQIGGRILDHEGAKRARGHGMRHRRRRIRRVGLEGHAPEPFESGRSGSSWPVPAWG